MIAGSLDAIMTMDLAGLITGWSSEPFAKGHAFEAEMSLNAAQADEVLPFSAFLRD